MTRYWLSRTGPVVLIAATVAVVGWWVAVSIDPGEWSGPTVLLVASLGIGITLIPIGTALSEPDVVVDGAIVAVLFVVIYLASVFATDSGDGGLAEIDNEIILGVSVACVFQTVSGVRTLTNAMVQRRQPPSLNDQTTAELLVCIRELTDRLDRFDTRPSGDRQSPVLTALKRWIAFTR